LWHWFIAQRVAEFLEELKADLLAEDLVEGVLVHFLQVTMHHTPNASWRTNELTKPGK